MNFVSLDFIVFLAVVLTIYWSLVSNRARLLFLTAASYVFYAWWDWRYCGLMFFVTVNAYLAGSLLGRVSQSGRKWIMATTIALDLTVLAFFKYFNFFLANAKSAALALQLEMSWPLFEVLLPVGISFYTFHAISYVMDVYREKVRAERSFLNVALYIAFFPQLIAGPIVRASLFLPQLYRTSPFRASQQVIGIKLFLMGFIYKVAIADRLAAICAPVFANIGQQDSKALLLAAIAFYGQIYFDFAGYSNMAIGTARFLGYRIPRNFNYPYSSLSVTEFWRRWHISLSSWLRDYLYIPLGGNRHGAIATYCNLLITMVLGGLWHGASWNFVIWGALHGLGLLFHKAWLAVRAWLGLINPVPFGWLVALLITQLWVFVAWIFFRMEHFSDAAHALRAILTLDAWAGLSPQEPAMWILLIIALDHTLGRITISPFIAREWRGPVFWLLAGSLIALGLFLAPLAQTTFIYFQF